MRFFLFITVPPLMCCTLLHSHASIRSVHQNLHCPRINRTETFFDYQIQSRETFEFTATCWMLWWDLKVFKHNKVNKMKMCLVHMLDACVIACVTMPCTTEVVFHLPLSSRLIHLLSRVSLSFHLLFCHALGFFLLRVCFFLYVLSLLSSSLDTTCELSSRDSYILHDC